MAEAACRVSGYLMFQAGIPLAVPARRVTEILPLAELVSLPASSSTVAGILNLRGTAVTILRVASLLGIDEPAPTIHSQFVRLNDVTPQIALLIEGSATIIDGADVELVPLSDKTTFNGCVEAQLVSGQSTTAQLLDLDQLLTEEERRRVAEFTRRQQERLDELEGLA